MWQSDEKSDDTVKQLHVAVNFAVRSCKPNTPPNCVGFVVKCTVSSCFCRHCVFLELAHKFVS